MTGRRAGARAVLLAALLALAGSAVAEVRPAGDPGLAAAGWRQLTFPPRPANAYRAGDDGAIEVTGEASVSMLFRPLDADPAETPIGVVTAFFGAPFFLALLRTREVPR